MNIADNVPPAPKPTKKKIAPKEKPLAKPKSTTATDVEEGADIPSEPGQPEPASKKLPRVILKLGPDPAKDASA